mgnify:CR=1 FL=1|jgi:hypothetical protein
MIFGTFFTISSENVSTTIGYVKDVIGDFMPLLVVIVAVGIGLIIFQVLVNVIRGPR